jgi:hypothetical protein
VKLTEEQVNDISEDLQQGFKVYINKETGEIRSIYDFGYLTGVPDPWEEELNRIKKNWPHHFEIRGMEPWEVFEIMEDFVQELIHKEGNTALHDALKDKRSFAKFRTLVEGTEYRESWYTFRKYRYLNYVQKKLRQEGLFE